MFYSSLIFARGTRYTNTFRGRTGFTREAGLRIMSKDNDDDDDDDDDDNDDAALRHSRMLRKQNRVRERTGRQKFSFLLFREITARWSQLILIGQS